MQHAYEHPITVEPVTLEGAHVRLEPLTMAHLEPLIASGATDPTLTQWFGSPITNVDELRAYIDAGLRERARGESVPFATIDRATGKTVGATRYMNIDRANHKLEIGFTFVCKPWQRSAVNTGAKYLMLRHAFETCGCMRVELKTRA